jgi:hypothetical protein
MNKFGAELDWSVAYGVSHGEYAPSNTITRFEYGNIQTGVAKRHGCRQSGCASADYDCVKIFAHKSPANDEKAIARPGQWLSLIY